MIISHKKKSILIVTQKLDLDDSYFGFFHDWVKRFSIESGNVTVIALEIGKIDLPSNVTVLPLKKGSKIISLFLLYKYSFQFRSRYDAVFCHMSPLYVISGWPIWKMLNKKISLWYVHRNVDIKLRIATLLVDTIFTATKESFKVQSKKINYMGQAVDTDRFAKPSSVDCGHKGILKIITVGRITPIKNLDVLIDALAILKDKKVNFEMNIVGATVMDSDIEHMKKLKKQVADLRLVENVKFLGAIPNKDLPKLYWENDVCVNLAPTGGLDKVVLEAMASGIPVIVVNKAFENHMGLYKDELIADEYNVKDFAEKIISLYKSDKMEEIGLYLRERVVFESSLHNLIRAIVFKI
jgi:glycosyltransferase involved in cell wall biosynthesis